MVDETRGSARRRYHYICAPCGQSAPTPADIARRAMIASGAIDPGEADEIARKIQSAITAYYRFTLVNGEH